MTLVSTAKVVPFAFAYKRNSQCRTIEIDVSQSIPVGTTLSVIPLGDLTPNEGSRSLPYWVIAGEASADSADPTLVRLTVKADLRKVKSLVAGEYTGAVRLLGPGITPLTVPVSISLKSSWWWLAFLVIMLGLGLGLLFKLNTEVGAKFRPLQRRFENIRRQYFPLSERPAGLRIEYEKLDAAIRAWDLDAAATAAEAIEKSLPAFIRLQPILARARDEIAVQGGSAVAYPKLPQLIEVETRKVDEAVDDAWPDPATKEGALRTLLTQITLVGYMLHADPTAFERALDLYLRGDFETGAARCKEIADGAGNREVVASVMAIATPGQLAPASPPTMAGRLRMRALRWRGRQPTSWKARFYERALPVIVGVTTAAIIVAVGFQSQYINKPTFGFGGFADWLALFVWGFVAGLSGKAVTEYTQQASGAAAPV